FYPFFEPLKSFIIIIMSGFCFSLAFFSQIIFISSRKTSNELDYFFP
ncbi:hypothetical protein X975_16870, partial [Stegodyphus mimosarum]